MKKMKFKSKIIKIISASLLMLIIFSLVPVVNLYAEDTNKEDTKGDISFSADGTDAPSKSELSMDIGKLFKRVNLFANKKDDSTLSNSFEEIINQFVDLIGIVGRYIMYALILFFGVRTIWEGVEGKAQFKELLPYLLIGIVFFWAAPGIKDLFVEIFNTDFSGDVNNYMGPIFGTVVTIVRIAAFAGIIFTGVKLMFSAADKKADAKSSLVPVLIGSIIVFAASTVVSLVLTTAKQAGIDTDKTVSTNNTQGILGYVSDFVSDFFGW